MQNEYLRLGQIIFDLEANVVFEDDDSNYEFLIEEFKRITKFSKR